MEEQIFCIRSQDQVLEGAQEGHPGMVSVKYIPLRPKDQQAYADRKSAERTLPEKTFSI
jgi:hypothetical protein